MGYERLLYAVGDAIKVSTNLSYVVEPSEVAPEYFHLRLTLLPHPIIYTNGRAALRINARLSGLATSSDQAISNNVELSLRLADYFADLQAVAITNGFNGMLSNRPLLEDDSAIIEVGDKGYEANSYWLLTLTFDIDKAIKNFETKPKKE